MIKTIAQPAPILPTNGSIPNAPPETVKKITQTKAKKFSLRADGKKSEKVEWIAADSCKFIVTLFLDLEKEDELFLTET